MTFSGTNDFIVEFDINGPDVKECFRLYEDGRYKTTKELPIIKTRHPNLVYGVIKGKKSWGLWVQEWSNGINEWSFKKEEIINEFIGNKIEIPESFMTEFENCIQRGRIKRIEKEIERLRGIGIAG